MSKLVFSVVTIAVGLGFSQGFNFDLFKSYIHGGQSVAHIGIQQGRLVFTNRDEFPYVAGLECMSRNICGATIIKNDAVLTAASCLNKCDIPFLTITAGGIFVAHRGIGQTYKVRNLQVHPDYKKNPGTYNDIAVVWTMKNFLFGPTIKPINLASQTSGDFLGEDVVVLGWGINEIRKQSLILTKSTMQVIPQHYCKNLYENENLARILCVIDVHRKVTPCIGDTGGPLVMHSVKNVAEDILVGLLPYVGINYGNCNGNIPSNFIKISAYHEWIVSTLQKPLQRKRTLRPTHPKPSAVKFLRVN